MTDGKTVVERAARDAVDQRGHRLMWVCLGIMLAGITAVLFAVFTVVDRNADQDATIADLGQQADNNASTAQVLENQVRELGGVPRVQAPQPGERGPKGDRGDPGEDGKNPPCLADPPHCQGVDGQDGAPGAAGVDGQPGRDGVDGAPGKDGVDGQDGENGEPPAGWTWVERDGREQSCTRDPGSPDAAATYTCTADPPRNTLPIPTPLGR